MALVNKNERVCAIAHVKRKGWPVLVGLGGKGLMIIQYAELCMSVIFLEMYPLWQLWS